MRSGARPSARAPRSAAHRPLWSGRIPVTLRGSGSGGSGPTPQRGSAKVGLRSCGWEVGDRSSGQSGCGAVQRGRREPGSNSRIQKGGRKGEGGRAAAPGSLEGNICRRRAGH